MTTKAIGPFLFQGKLPAGCTGTVTWQQAFVPDSGYSAADKPDVITDGRFVYVVPPRTDDETEFGPVSPGVLTLTPTVTGDGGSVTLDPIALCISFPDVLNVYDVSQWPGTKTTDGEHDVLYSESFGRIINFYLFELNGEDKDVVFVLESPDLTAEYISHTTWGALPPVMKDLSQSRPGSYIAGFTLGGCTGFEVSFEVFLGEASVGVGVASFYYDTGCG